MGTLLEFSVRAGMYGTSCVSSVLSVCDNYQSFTTIVLSAAVARCIRRWTMDHRVISGESLRPLITVRLPKIYFHYDFYFGLMLGLVDF